MDSTFTAVFKKVGDWYIAYAEELPGANSQGKTLEEARENLREAIALIITSNRELAGEESGDVELIREEIRVRV